MLQSSGVTYGSACAVYCAPGFGSTGNAVEAPLERRPQSLAGVAMQHAERQPPASRDAASL